MKRLVDEEDSLADFEVRPPVKKARPAVIEVSFPLLSNILFDNAEPWY
jgi:hypothetical protein